jgi:hypothetical protein
MLPLHHHGTDMKCAGSEGRGNKKNDDTEVSSFSVSRYTWNFQSGSRHLKEYRKPIVRKTLEIYGVDEGSRTPGLQDHNLAL